MTPRLSVVVLGYRNDDTILAAVESVVEQSCRMEIEPIVITSGGGDGARRVAERHPHVTVHSVQERWTVAEARNQGIRMATGDIIAFLAADCRARRGWAAAREKAHEAGHRVVSGPVSATVRPTAGLAHALLNYHTRSPSMPAEVVTWPDPRVHSCSYTRDVFTELGVFDPERNRGEDSEMARRLAAAGIGIWFEPAAVIDHTGPTSLRALARDEYQRAHRFVRVNDLQTDRSDVHLLRELSHTVGRTRAALAHLPEDARPDEALSLVVHVVIGALTHRAGRLRGLLQDGNTR